VIIINPKTKPIYWRIYEYHLDCDVIQSTRFHFTTLYGALHRTRGWERDNPEEFGFVLDNSKSRLGMRVKIGEEYAGL
jgi:hypothetical protein